MQRFSASCQRILVVLTVAFLAASCSLTDAEQDSLCRRVIPALFDVGSGVRVLQSQSDGARTLTVRFWLASDERIHRLDCQFRGEGLDANKRRLEALQADGALVGQAALYLVTSRWLETQEAIAEMPLPATSNALLPNVSPRVAFSIQHVLSGLPKMAIYALVAAAYALIYGLICRINLVFGSLAALGGILAVLSVMLINAAGYPSIPWGILLAIVASAITVALYGGAMARCVFVPLMGASGQQMVIASLGLLVAMEELLRIAQGSNSLWLPPIFNAPVTIARSSLYDATVTPMAIATAAAGGAVALSLKVFMETTHFGRDWRAVADDPAAAELFGISSPGMVMKAFALAAALAGFAGLLIISYYGGMGFAGGTMLGLGGVAAAVVGGIGSVSAAMLGGVVIAGVEILWTAFFPIEHKDLVVFLLLAAVLIFKPTGLFDGRAPVPMRV